MPFGAVRERQNEVVHCFACLLVHPDTCLNTVLVFMRPQDDFCNVYLQKHLNIDLKSVRINLDLELNHQSTGQFYLYYYFFLVLITRIIYYHIYFSTFV